MKDYVENEELVHGLIKGDEEAYAQLVDRYHHGLCVYANNLVRDMDMAEDIVQNVLVKVWVKRHKLNPELSLKGFLYRSVYNEFIDQYRKQRFVTVLEKKHIELLDTIIEEDDSKMEALFKMVLKEMQNLPPKCKRIFLLSKQEGLSNTEISQYLEISPKTVEAHLTRAFGILRKRMEAKADWNSVLFILFGRLPAHS